MLSEGFMVRIGLRKTLAIALLVLSAMCSTVVGDEEYILWDYSAYTTNQVGIFESNPEDFEKPN